jgi:hypothetical protein
VYVPSGANARCRGGTELSLSLSRHAACALGVIQSVRDERFKVRAVELALISEARRILSNRERIKRFVAERRIDPRLAEDWARAMEEIDRPALSQDTARSATGQSDTD